MKQVKTWKDNNGIEHSGEVLVSKDKYDAIRCSTCEFIHVIPLPSDSELEEYYKNIFYDTFKPNYIKSHEKDIEWWNSVYKDRMQLFNKYLKNEETKSILDIGSGPGFFLKYFKENGWNVLGVEPSSTAAEFSNLELGVEVINQPIDKIDSSVGKFDIIYSNQTFEHLKEPIKTLSFLKSLLKENGLIYLCVANEFNPIQEIVWKEFNENPWWFIPPEHINYFQPESIKKLLEKSGFEVLEDTSTFPIDLFLLMEDNYLGNDVIGKQCHQRRKNLEKNLLHNKELKKNLYNAFKNAGIGREIEILARTSSNEGK